MIIATFFTSFQGREIFENSWGSKAVKYFALNSFLVYRKVLYAHFRLEAKFGLVSVSTQLLFGVK